MKIVMGGTRYAGPPEPFVKELRATFPDADIQPAASQEEQMDLIRDADAFYGRPSREVFMAANKLRWIHNPGTGIDQLTAISEIVESDVVITNARGPHAPPMADHVMGMILTLAHQLNEMWDDQTARRWDPHKYNHRQMELAGTTMGILAIGDIGTQVAVRAHGFGINVYAVDINPRSAPAYVKEIWGLDRLDELLSISDWFVVTAPQTDETKGLIDGRRIGLLKDGAFVIVISRGEIVDELALNDAVRSGRLGGAGIDAFAEEPLPQDSPLWDAPNVLITPHASALTPEMTEARQRIFKENLSRFLDNKPFLYVCDKRAGF